MNLENLICICSVPSFQTLFDKKDWIWSCYESPLHQRLDFSTFFNIFQQKWEALCFSMHDLWSENETVDDRTQTLNPDINRIYAQRDHWKWRSGTSTGFLQNCIIFNERLLILHLSFPDFDGKIFVHQEVDLTNNVYHCYVWMSRLTAVLGCFLVRCLNPHISWKFLCTLPGPGFLAKC